MDPADAHTLLRVASRLLLPCLLLGLACGAPPPDAPGDTAQLEPGGGSASTGTTGGPGAKLLYRFRMDQPANEDFAFKDDLVHVYARPFEDNIAVRIQGREQNFIRIYWNDCEFTDILGNRYKVVPPNIDFSQATLGIPPTDIPAGQLWSGRLRILDTTAGPEVLRLGGNPFPIVPPNAGTPEQIRGALFELVLDLEINGLRQTYPFSFEIRDAYYR
jgi:hypothetical protein